jgi:hypothetical protein
MGFAVIFSYMNKIHFAPIDPSLFVLPDSRSLPPVISFLSCGHLLIFMLLDYTYESKHATVIFLSLV